MQTAVNTSLEQMLVCCLAPVQMGEQAADMHDVVRDVRASHCIAILHFQSINYSVIL